MKKIITVLLIGIYCFICQYGYCLAPKTQFKNERKKLIRTPKIFFGFDLEEDLRIREQKMRTAIRESIQFGSLIYNLQKEGNTEEADRLIEERRQLINIKYEKVANFAWFKVRNNFKEDKDIILKPLLFSDDYNCIQGRIDIVNYNEDDNSQSQYLETIKKAFNQLLMFSTTKEGKQFKSIMEIFDNRYEIILTNKIASAGYIDKDKQTIYLNKQIVRPDCLIFIRYLLLHEMLRANYMDESLGEVNLLRTELLFLKSLDNRYTNHIKELNFNLEILYGQDILEQTSGKDIWDFRSILNIEPYSTEFETIANNYIALGKMA